MCQQVLDAALDWYAMAVTKCQRRRRRCGTFVGRADAPLTLDAARWLARAERYLEAL